jgi:hypothetical protein
MCKPSCCKPSHDGAGIAAVAVIAGAALLAAKIGPIMARIAHLAIEVATIILVTAGSALVLIAATWLTLQIVRWQIRQHHAHRQPVLRPVPFTTPAIHHGRELECLACGDTGQVLRAITGSRYLAEPCPACEPIQRAGWS